MKHQIRNEVWDCNYICNYCQKVIEDGEKYKTVYHKPFKGVTGYFHEECLGREIVEYFGLELKKQIK
ncbi:MAG: hypothetical protein I3273_04705 [Candidatus Moeniiplasma glomeromycotorum]|nr:hypothetical protein [Candidatus Moeniiplasma glomeromycotorum]MCE8169394.1 hypothetical protein [Candidatus Moeniiplasma glomeromycotorum]